MSSVSGERVGPHPVPQFQMIFKNEQFQTVVPWLMLSRDGLDILIHPLLGPSSTSNRAPSSSFSFSATGSGLHQPRHL
jgi:aromatic ring-cleaving dioxygenase